MDETSVLRYMIAVPVVGSLVFIGACIFSIPLSGLAWFVLIGFVPATQCLVMQLSTPWDGSISLTFWVIPLVSTVIWYRTIKSFLEDSHSSDIDDRDQARVSRIVFWLAFLVCFPGVIWMFYSAIGAKAVLAAILVPFPMWYLVARDIRALQWYLKMRAEADQLDGVISKALVTMDRKGGGYDSERAAKQELHSLLATLLPYANVEYEARISKDTTADIKIDSTLVQCKLNLMDTAEADRLIGQLTRYCQQPHYRVKVVVCGEVHPEIEERIRRESRERYGERVSIIGLHNPQRIAE